ncbi:MAG: YqjF family protein [Phycisphaeraceae bacterium]
MTWRHLLFVHWPVEPACLSEYIPPPLKLDTWGGEAWLGVVPFQMENVRARWLPPIAGQTRFPEINLRTYVRHAGRSGVYFFSLDIPRLLATGIARLLWHLPYHRAKMSCEATEGDWIEYEHHRPRRGGTPPATFRGRYRPTGPVALAESGSLAHFLTHRLCLFASGRRDRVWRGEIDHAPWPLQPAEMELDHLDMTRLVGDPQSAGPPLLYYADRLDVHAWLPVRS